MFRSALFVACFFLLFLCRADFAGAQSQSQSQSQEHGILCKQAVSQPSYTKNCENSVVYSTHPVECPVSYTTTDLRSLDRAPTETEISSVYNANFGSGFSSGIKCYRY